MPEAPRRHDVLVYGATVAGITAAIELRRAGLTPVIVDPSGHLGGMTTSGLGRTDFGDRSSYRGLAAQLYREIGAFYTGEGRDRGATVHEDGSVWYFEPSVAELVLRRWIDEHEIEVAHRSQVARVRTSHGRITAIEVEDGATYQADAFIDASYEADLAALAGVSYRVGREANSEFGETANGIQFGSPHHRFNVRVDPYVRPGRPDSGLLPLISEAAPGTQGDPDLSVQAYNFRLCLTDRPDNRLPIPCPDGYDPARYELLGRYVRAGVLDVFDLNVALAGGKTDMNNRGAVGTDHIGANHDWPTASPQRRQEIFADHLSYTQGLLHYLQHDDSLPAAAREQALQWGLPADEFVDTGGWPRQLYVREARRIVGQFTMTEPHVRGFLPVPDVVARGSYGLDSHHCRRVLIDGAAVNEGDVEHPVRHPYGIALGSLLPQPAECTNLAVPVCVSATHIAYGSIRMEPVFASLGEVAGVVVGQAVATGRAVQDVPYAAVRQRLDQLA